MGTGRSGTYSLARNLASRPDIEAPIEDAFVSREITRMALDPALRPHLMPAVIRRVRIRHALIAPRHYPDKSYPALWVADLLASGFPSARFIGIHRDVYATVASMLKHGGVLHWQREWRSYPVSNHFLGIDDEISTIYDSLSSAEQCALRWVAHRNRMKQMSLKLHERFLIVEYERLAQTPARP